MHVYVEDWRFAVRSESLPQQLFLVYPSNENHP
jgi:hypothetical protein